MHGFESRFSGRFFLKLLVSRLSIAAASRQRPWNDEVSVFFVYELAPELPRAQAVKQCSVGFPDVAAALEPSQFLNRVSPPTQRVLRLFFAEASTAVTADVLKAAAGVRVRRGVESLAPLRLLPLFLFVWRGF